MIAKHMKPLRTTALLLAVSIAALLSASCRGPHCRAAMVPATRATLEAVAMALEMYRVDCGAFPQQEQGLRALMINPGVTNWAGPYIRGNTVIQDAWGTPVGYLTTERSITLLSAGADISFGTADDITRIISWNRFPAPHR